MASGLSVTVEGLERAKARLNKFDARHLHSVTQRSFSTAGRKVRDAIKTEAPQRTGNLRRSITSRGRRGTWLIGPTARHRHLVIRGTGPRRSGSHGGGGVMPKNPFVDRAVQRMAPGITHEVSQAIIGATR